MKNLLILFICFISLCNAKILTFSYNTPKCIPIEHGYCYSHDFSIKYNPEKGRLSISLTDFTEDKLFLFNINAYDSDSMWIRTIYYDAQIGMDYISNDSSSSLFFTKENAKEIKYINISWIDKPISWSNEYKCYNDDYIPWEIKNEHYNILKLFCAPKDTLFKNMIMNVSDIDSMYWTNPMKGTNTTKIIWLDIDGNDYKIICKNGFYNDTITTGRNFQCLNKLPNNSHVSNNGFNFECNAGYLKSNNTCIIDSTHYENILDTIINVKQIYLDTSKYYNTYGDCLIDLWWNINDIDILKKYWNNMYKNVSKFCNKFTK